MTLKGIAELGTERARSRRQAGVAAVERLIEHGAAGDNVGQILVFRDSATGEWLATTTVFPAHYRNEETR